MNIQLIYDSDCPNVDATREHLRQACEQAGVTTKWREWDRSDDSVPSYVKAHGSPTVLIDGHDVGGLDEGIGNCCRIYEYEGQIHGVPPVSMIADRLSSVCSDGGVLSSLATVPAAIVSIMPTLTCPACWPAYASLLGSLGLGFMIDSAYLMPITLLALLVAVGMIAIKAGQRHGYSPLMLGALAALAIVIGKFWLEVDSVVYGGAVLLIAASIWNAWPRKQAAQVCGNASCCATSQCEPMEVTDV